MGRPMYGSAMRAEKGKSKLSSAEAQVLSNMASMIAAHLPALSEKPVNSEEFNTQVKSFQGFLRTEYQDSTRLRIAYHALASYVATGNEKGWWQLDIPSMIARIPRTTSSRSQKNFKAGVNAGRFYESWLQKLANEKHSPDLKVRLADVLISAVFYGGLANPRAVTSLANLLVSEPKPLQIADGHTAYVWIDLVLSGGNDPLNDRVSSESGTSWQTLQRFYPDNRTLAQLLKLQHIKIHKTSEKLEVLDQPSVWAIIESRMASRSQKKSIISLGTFCQGAQTITETLPGVELPQALLECAAGRVGSVSLPPKFVQNWLLKSFDENTPNTFSLSDVQIVSKSSLATGAPERVILKHPEHVGGITPVDVVIKKAREALQSEVSGEKNTPARAIKRLQELRNQALPFNAAILVDWLLDRLTYRKIKVSSARRYFSALARLWLFHTNEADIDDMDENELEQIYRQILTFKPGDEVSSQNYLQGRLQDLHGFACQSDQYGLPDLTSYFECVGDTQKQSQVRAGFIPEHNYQGMLQGIQNLTGLDRDTKEGLSVLLILAYRTGMRRGELLKLRLSDIERSDEHWLYVVSNRYGNNKTDSARRRVPVYLLLLPSELERFRHYVYQRGTQNKNHLSTLLFSESHAVTVPHSGTMVSGLTKALLSFQGLDELSFHHLRHSTLTTLFIVMEESPDLIEALTGYSREQAKRIRSELFCSNPMCDRDKYSALAGLAGHLSPDTTFLYYIHETSLFIWRRLTKYDPVLEKEHISSLSGLSSQTINTHFKDSGIAVRLSALRPEILKRLAPMSRRFQSSDIGTMAAEAFQYASPKPRATVLDCYTVLRDLEGGDPISTLCVRYSIDKTKIKGWLEAATQIQNLVTKAGNRRHFPKRMSSTAIGIPLAPIRPQDRATAKETDRVISLLRGAFGKDKGAIRWCIDYWKKNTSQTKQGIRFTCLDDAEKFINSLEKVIPKRRWELNILLAPKARIEELNVWRSLGISTHLQEAAQGKSIQAYLRLRHVNEDEIVGKRKNIKQYSSQLLNYVFHMLAIMVDGDSIEKP